VPSVEAVGSEVAADDDAESSVGPVVPSGTSPVAATVLAPELSPESFPGICCTLGEKQPTAKGKVASPAVHRSIIEHS
jgi:hypothetical protein